MIARSAKNIGVRIDVDDVARLQEIREEFEVLLHEATEIVRHNVTSNEFQRCKAYWIAYIDNAIGCSIGGEQTLLSTCEELQEQADEQEEWEAKAPELGEDEQKELRAAGADYASDNVDTSIDDLANCARDLAIGILNAPDCAFDSEIIDCAADIVYEGMCEARKIPA